MWVSRGGGGGVRLSSVVSALTRSIPTEVGCFGGFAVFCCCFVFRNNLIVYECMIVFLVHSFIHTYMRTYMHT